MEKLKIPHLKWIIYGLIGIFCIPFCSKMFENVNAGEICVIQMPFTGSLVFHYEPGLKFQLFGAVTTYPKESQFWFSSHPEEGASKDESIKIRFNDGGHANLSGSIRFRYPLNDNDMRKIHQAYGSHEAMRDQLIRTLVTKSVYMTGPLMSSKESYAEKRTQLISFIEDQASNGIYKTRTREIKGIDPITSTEKTFTVVEIVQDTSKQLFLRQDKSPLGEYGLALFNLSINEIKYDEIVEKQITAQQRLAMDVQTSIAEVKKAEQNVIKVEKEGQADAAKAKWQQEVIKAQQITEAEQKKEVAKLNAQEAEYYKKEQILRGEADATKNRKLLEADGALQAKLDAWVSVNKAYAEGIGKFQGNLVPSVIMGDQKGGGSSSSNLIELILAKTAKDLSLDISSKK